MPLAHAPSNGGRRARSTASASAAIALASLMALAGGAAAGTSPAELRMCASARHVGPDSSRVGGSRQIGLDRGLAQSFVADDTLVRAISVWLPGPSRRLAFPLHLYVTHADGAGRPLVDAVVADAGTLRDGGGKGAQPARFRWEFSPPLSLPAPGAYAIVLMPDECGIVSVLTTGYDEAPDGRLWEVGRRACLDPAQSLRSEVGPRDLLYEIVYCDRGTGAPGRTWGEIRTRYR